MICPVGTGGETDILFPKHDSYIFRQSSNPVCGSKRSQASSLWVKRHIATSSQPNLVTDQNCHPVLKYLLSLRIQRADGPDDPLRMRPLPQLPAAGVRPAADLDNFQDNGMNLHRHAG